MVGKTFTAISGPININTRISSSTPIGVLDTPEPIWQLYFMCVCGVGYAPRWLCHGVTVSRDKPEADSTKSSWKRVPIRQQNNMSACVGRRHYLGDKPGMEFAGKLRLYRT